MADFSTHPPSSTFLKTSWNSIVSKSWKLPTMGTKAKRARKEDFFPFPPLPLSSSFHSLFLYAYLCSFLNFMCIRASSTRVQTGAKDGGSWKSRLYEIQRPEKIIPSPLPRRLFKAATQLRNFVYCVVCKRLRIAAVKSGEDSIFCFPFHPLSKFDLPSLST